MPSVLPLVVRTSFRFNGRIHNDRFVTQSLFHLATSVSSEAYCQKRTLIIEGSANQCTLF